MGLSKLIGDNYWKRVLVTGMSLLPSCLPLWNNPPELKDSNLETEVVLADAEVSSTQYDSPPDIQNDSLDSDPDLESSLISYDTHIDTTKDIPAIDLTPDSLLIQYDSHPDTPKDSADADSSLETSLIFYDTLISSDFSTVNSDLETSSISNDTSQSIDAEKGGVDLAEDSVTETQSCTQQTYFQDKDGDGFGDPNTSQDFCLPLEGWVLDPTDCNDVNSAVFPQAPELCDGLDNQCPGDNGAGKIDENLTLEQKCGVTDLGECNFGIEYNYCLNGNYTGWFGCTAKLPDLKESCDGKDNDCDGLIDEGLAKICLTICGTGQEYCINGVWHGCDAPTPKLEICDYKDNNCDGLTDENFEVGTTCDLGVGECKSEGTKECSQTSFVTYCNATPKLPQDETCNSLDDDCDGIVDNNLTEMVSYLDFDADGYGNKNLLVIDCEVPLGYVTNSNDCNDFDSNLNPAADEVCDNYDNNCNFKVDEGLIKKQQCGVTDTGECSFGLESSFCVDGQYTTWADCSAILPEIEICDKKDNNCNGKIDEELTLEQKCGFNNEGICKLGTEKNYCGNGEYSGWLNCDAILPGNEICDNKDNNCDGLTDNNLLQLCYSDCGEGLEICVKGNWEGCTAPQSQLEICDYEDNNCNNLVDEGFDVGDACYLGEGVCKSTGLMQCENNGFSTYCDAIPQEPEIEICNGLDDNCNGITDDGWDNLCDDGLYCTGKEICLGNLGCQSGIPVDCSANNLEEIAVCNYSPDNNSLTFDQAQGFLSICNEKTDSCTLGEYELIHACEVSKCAAECDQTNPCPQTECDNLDGCYNGTYRDYQNANNSCLEDCTCTTTACDSYQEIITDADGDGFDLQCELDCDDDNYLIHPNLNELCDGLDNDCDNKTDEELTLGQLCGIDIGECKTGLQYKTCTSGQWSNWGSCQGEISPTDEKCDNKDNNCDGKTDENNWDKTFGGSGPDLAHVVQQTTDGGYIVAGSTASKGVGGTDTWVLKLDSSGVSQWDQTFGGSSDDLAYSIQQTNDLGYVVAGSKNGDSAWVLKLDSNGALQWNKVFAESNSLRSIQQTTDGGYITAGTTGNVDASILKLNSNGALQWNKSIGEVNTDYARSIQQTNDLGYIVAGYKGFNADDAWVFKLDPTGAMQWDKIFVGAGQDVANSIQQTTDGGYIIAGFTDSKGAGMYDAWVLKLNSNGALQWDQTFGGSSKDITDSIKQTTDGGYIVAGYTASKGAGMYDAWVLKLNSNGTLQWDQTFGGSGEDKMNSISQTIDNGYIVAGSTASKGAGGNDIWVLKLDKNGKLNCK